jgi:hypothetical protein
MPDLHELCFSLHGFRERGALWVEGIGKAGVPSELSSFTSDGDGGLRQEGRQNYRGQVCHRKTDRETKVGQASVCLEGGLHEDDDGRSSKVGVSRTCTWQ